MQVDNMFVVLEKKHNSEIQRNICVVWKDLSELRSQNRGSWLH